MKISSNVLWLLVFLPWVGGCAGTTGNQAQSEQVITGSSWALTSLSLNGEDHTAPDNNAPTFQLSEGGQASGSTGCNTYQGTCTVKGQSIRFGPLASTKMACLEPEGRMALEQHFLLSLSQVTYFNMDGGVLTLHGPDGTALRFRNNDQ